MAEFVSITLESSITKPYRVDIPLKYGTTDWAVHRPAHARAGRVSLEPKGWRVTHRGTGKEAWTGTNLNTAKKTAKALQAVTDTVGAIPAYGEAPQDVLKAHAKAAGRTA